MSFINDWNSRPLKSKTGCKCNALAGNSFQSVPTEITTSNFQNISLHIDEDGTFSLTVAMAFTTDGENYMPITNSTNGRWECCTGSCGKNSLWYGVAVLVVGFPEQIDYPTTVYRLTVEIDPKTLIARVKLVFFDYLEGTCVSTYFPEDPQDAMVFDPVVYQLQPLVSNCGADFAREPLPTPPRLVADPRRHPNFHM